MSKPEKFRFAVSGTFELEFEATSERDAENQAMKVVRQLPGVVLATVNATPSRDWQVLSGSKK